MATGDKFPVIMAKEKDIANGVPGLDASGKIKKSQIPDLGINESIISHNNDETAHNDIRILVQNAVESITNSFTDTTQYIDWQIENHTHNSINSDNGVEYKVTHTIDGNVGLDIVGEYTEFTVTADNKEQIGYSGMGMRFDLVIPAFFIGEDGETYKVTSIADNAFAECGNLYTVIIPDTVISIGNGAFYNTNNLSTLVIGNSVTTIGNKAFENSFALRSLTIPDSVTTIGDYAFYHCNNLSKISIGNNVTSIGMDAFSSAPITSITIPDKVTNIGINAFYGCDKLTTVNLSDSVTTVGQSAFYACPLIANVYYKGTTNQWNSIIFNNNNERLLNAKRYYNCNLESAYRLINSLQAEIATLKSLHALQQAAVVE